ncbi:MAG TPA: helix-turn-helix domain-containing protein [Casimicrobiaceae bacterium]|nr:helix-turn-helix domain-containing protein [Casimicrobiaceae bacterium]
MRRPIAVPDPIAAAWKLARSGELRGAAETARKLLGELGAGAPAGLHVELRLVVAFCAMRQGDHPDAIRELDAAAHSASSPEADGGLSLRVETWRAELAYFQGRYHAANEIIDRVLEPLEKNGDWAYAAFALRVRIAILLARADYQGIAALADRALRDAETSGDDYVIVQILNVLGAFHFDCATSKLREPHARGHLSSLDPRDTGPMEAEAQEALHFFQRAREVADRARYEFAAWYVAGNIERLEIILGHADRAVRAIRKRLKILQARGAKYDEIVTRSNLAWGLRVLGRYDQALQELEAALSLARETRTSNVLLEFLEYDRSIVLGALGDAGGAQASYRRYLRLVSGRNRHAEASSTGDAAPPVRKRPLEPFFLKSADRFIQEHIGETLLVGRLAEHCGVSQRTLEKAFADLRGITPVAHMRNLRLDHARRALDEGGTSVADAATRFGFRSSTTFALEYRKRFGSSPSHRKRVTAS